MKIKEKLGLEYCKFAFTGAAPISKETLSYFGALGIQINDITDIVGPVELCKSTDCQCLSPLHWRRPRLKLDQRCVVSDGSALDNLASSLYMGRYIQAFQNYHRPHIQYCHNSVAGNVHIVSCPYFSGTLDIRLLVEAYGLSRAPQGLLPTPANQLCCH